MSVSLALVGLALAGCKGVPTQSERAAQREFEEVTKRYSPEIRPQNSKLLNTNLTLRDSVHFAMRNNPQVETAYYEWAAAIQRITIERSLPDPRLTFESDIADIVETLMPGLMIDLPGPGKLKAAANVAAAESRTKYFTFQAAVIESAFRLKKAYYLLYFVEAKISVNKDTLVLVRNLEKLARAQNAAGKSTLQDVLRSQIEEERLAIEIVNLEDSRNPLLEQWKAALGLEPNQTAPQIPSAFESTSMDLAADALLSTALARNPKIRGMAAELERADAFMRMAYKARVPDFSIGLEADVKAAPIMYRPQLGITLPIWRDKIAAQIAEAQAGKKAAEARLSAEQIMLAVDFAEKSFIYREATRNVELISDRLLPKARQSVEVAQTGYTSAKTDFLDVLDAERTLLELTLAEVEARVQRELALAEISLIIVGIPPPSAPLLAIPVAEGKEVVQ